ncbi:MAG: choice-of-anchor L domain-containing protein [Bradymonadaceae bacterium]|nr:choice-of-anchor L domain-containing protein [Lujinxingiaceae bacterium]
MRSNLVSFLTKAVPLAMLALSSTAAFAQTSVVTTTDTTILAPALLGSSGAITITGATYIGHEGAVGAFEDGPYGLAKGVAISNGLVAAMPFVTPKTNPSSSLEMDSHALCESLTNTSDSFDAALLEITFDVADGVEGIQFDYVLGSQEYPDWIGGNFFDAFGVFLNGVNVALDTNGNAVTTNSPYFTLTGGVVLHPLNQSNFNASTPLLTTRAGVVSGSTDNTLVLVICDAGDDTLDSGAFIAGLKGCEGDCEGTSICGNGALEAGEQCDGALVSLAFAECPSGYTGTPLCNNNLLNLDGTGACNFAAVPFGCVDINECDENADICGMGECSNFDGSYECACDSGFEFDGLTCIDVNECDLDPLICGPGECVNEVGFYDCACDAGFEFDDISCVDINECEFALGVPSNVCGAGSCTNESGYYECACDTGFVFDGETCADINECLDLLICGPGSCTNEPGSYQCACDSGYASNGLTCLDIDECALNAAICGPGTCENREGTYDCACNAGFEFNGTSCVDINECALNAAICGPGTCENLEGTYDCACNSGFASNGVTCLNVNECADIALNDCDVNAACSDTEGSFDCNCHVGYAGPGTFCAAVIAITEPAPDLLTNNARPMVQGVSDPGALVTITINGVEVGTAEADANGLWAFLPTEDIADGDALIVANDNYSSAQVTITVDTIAPELEVYTPVHAGVYLVSPETVEGGAEAFAQIDIVINDVHLGATTADLDGEWSFELEALGDGDYKLVVTATDAASNETEVVVDFIVDTTAELIILQPSQDAVVRTATPTVSGEAEPNAVVEIIIDGVVVGTVVADDNGAWSWQPNAPLAEGELTVTAFADSAAGNRADSVTFTIDTSTTGVTFDSHNDGDLINKSRPTFSGSAAPGATVTIFVDGVQRGTVTANTNGNWSWRPSADLADGAHIIEAEADDDGIVSDARINITVDTLAPALVLETPGERAEVAADSAVSGTAEPGAKIDVYVDCIFVGTTTADADGKWSVNLPEGLDPEEMHGVEVIATDAAGNEALIQHTFFVERLVETGTGALHGGGGMDCSSTSGSQPVSLFLLAAFALIAVRRRSARCM